MEIRVDSSLFFFTGKTSLLPRPVCASLLYAVTKGVEQLFSGGSNTNKMKAIGSRTLVLLRLSSSSMHYFFLDFPRYFSSEWRITPSPKIPSHRHNTIAAVTIAVTIAVTRHPSPVTVVHHRHEACYDRGAPRFF